MDYFKLPSNTTIQRVIPKNSFDSFTNSKQKDMFTKDVAKITWSNSISTATINLPSKEIQEIQIFSVELKEKKEIKTLLEIIDKAIPYHIIFIIEFDDSMYISTSSKHSSSLNDTKSVIDWTFKTEWFRIGEKDYKLEFKKDIDFVYYDFCNQLSLKLNKNIKNITDLAAYNSKISSLTREIEQLKRSITSCQQFNKKVELNLKLKKLERELEVL